MAKLQRAYRPPRERSHWLLGIMLAGFGLVFLRLFYLQILRHDHYVNHTARLIEPNPENLPPPEPGRILDRNGQSLAVSAMQYHLIADPRRMLRLKKMSFQEVAAKLEPHLGRPAAEISQVLEREHKRGYWVLQPWLKRDKVKAIKDLKIEGLTFRQVWRRNYPLGKGAAHLLGGRDRFHRALGGLEHHYRLLLDGQPGAGGAAAYTPGLAGLKTGAGTLPPLPGKDLVLTLDADLQRQVEIEMDRLQAQETPKYCTCLIMDPRTGDILAVSSRPNYDPGHYVTGRPGGSDYRAGISLEQTTNWPVACEVEEGSTFKVVLAAALLSSHKVPPTQRFHCGGRLNLGGAPIGCWGKYAVQGHGSLDMAGMLANSCNICAGQMALKMGRRYYRDFLDNCGIGSDPQAGLPGEAFGHLAKTENIRPRDLATMAFGQNVSCSSLQLTSIIGGLVNDGKLMRPRILIRAMNKDATPFRELPPLKERDLCTPEVSAQLRTMMEGVVTQGTGRAAAIPGVRVGGKTGTAQQWDPVTKRHSQDRYLVSFIMVLPADKPRYVIHVTCYEPQRGQHGSDVAAPVCQRLGEYILRQIDPALTTQP